MHAFRGVPKCLRLRTVAIATLSPPFGAALPAGRLSSSRAVQTLSLVTTTLLLLGALSIGESVYTK